MVMLRVLTGGSVDGVDGDVVLFYSFSLFLFFSHPLNSIFFLPFSFLSLPFYSFLFIYFGFPEFPDHFLYNFFFSLG